MIEANEEDAETGYTLDDILRVRGYPEEVILELRLRRQRKIELLTSEGED